MVMRVLQELCAYSGLQVNMGKSFAVLNRHYGPDPAQSPDLTIKERVRYLGVQIGHVNAEQAYATPMAKMKARAALSKTLPLDLHEKTEILKI